MCKKAEGCPFVGTSLDANREFYRGPGQGPGTDTEPYLRTTVRCLYLFAAWRRAGAGGTAVRCALFRWDLGAEQTEAVGAASSTSPGAKPVGSTWCWRRVSPKPVLRESPPLKRGRERRAPSHRGSQS